MYANQGGENHFCVWKQSYSQYARNPQNCQQGYNEQKPTRYYGHVQKVVVKLGNLRESAGSIDVRIGRKETRLALSFGTSPSA